MAKPIKKIKKRREIDWRRRRLTLSVTAAKISGRRVHTSQNLPFCPTIITPSRSLYCLFSSLVTRPRLPDPKPIHPSISSHPHFNNCLFVHQIHTPQPVLAQAIAHSTPARSSSSTCPFDLPMRNMATIQDTQLPSMPNGTYNNPIARDSAYHSIPALHITKPTFYDSPWSANDPRI